jgi:hypothetical protein
VVTLPGPWWNSVASRGFVEESARLAELAEMSPTDVALVDVDSDAAEFEELRCVV